jgi:hypothetical protein
VLPLHECAAEPLQDATELVADPTADEATADPAVVESAAESLHSAADHAGSGATVTETFCLCVHV